MQIKNDPSSNPILTEMLERTRAPERTNNSKGIEAPSKTDPLKKADPFQEVLEQKVQPNPAAGPELKFSAHAKSRLSSRGIELSSDEILKMQEAVQKAGQKGSKESLILTDKAAFIVSVKNNTVITAVDKNSLKENLFTNIDSTIMI